MTLQQTIKVPVGRNVRFDSLPQKEYPFGIANDGLHIITAKSEDEASQSEASQSEDELMMPQEKPLTEAEVAAHTQYILRELARSEKKIADGKGHWHSKEEAFTRLDAVIEALEAR
jgi:hypothetical protein